MGKAWFHLKQYPKSDEAFDEALKINANDPLVLQHYSYCLAARGERLDRAKELATRLIDLAPNLSVSENAYAFVLYKMKDYNAAMKMFPGNLEMQYWTAVTLANNKELEKALPIFKKVFTADKNWKELTRRLPAVKLLTVSDTDWKRIMGL